MDLPGTARYRNPDATEPTVLKLGIFVSIIIVLTIMAGGFFLNLKSEKPVSSEMENLAFETYTEYSQKLDAISKKYAKELDAIQTQN
jgi:hypothetical protein